MITIFNISTAITTLILLPKFFRRKDGSLDRIIEIKMTLAQIRPVGELKYIFRFCIYLHVNLKKNTLI